MWTRAPLLIPVALTIVVLGLVAAALLDALEFIARPLRRFVWGSRTVTTAAEMLGWYILPVNRRRWRETWIERGDDKTV